MKLREDALNVKILFTIIADIMVVGSGVHLHLPIQEIFVPNSEIQSRGILDATSDHFYTLRSFCDDLLIWKTIA